MMAQARIKKSASNNGPAQKLVWWLSYYFSLPAIYLVSILPFPLLYKLSDGLFILIYRLFRYRKSVVARNLRHAFPHKTDMERNQLMEAFYRHFCDLTLESIKNITITEHALREHIHFSGVKVFEEWYHKKQSLIVVMGHLGCWEWAGSRFGVEPSIHQLYNIYHPLKHPYFEKLVYRMRTRTGNGLYAMNEVLRGIIQNRNQVTATTFIADQTPSYTHTYWTTFLNQETPVFLGAERIAKSTGYPVVYVGLRKLERGVYDIHAETLVEDPKNMPEHTITEKHTRRLEQDILAQPEIWLWTHRRWKKEKPDNIIVFNPNAV